MIALLLVIVFTLMILSCVLFLLFSWVNDAIRYRRSMKQMEAEVARILAEADAD